MCYMCQVMHEVLKLIAREQPAPFAQTLAAREGGSATAKALLHWALRGAALQLVALRRAVRPQQRGVDGVDEGAECEEALASLKGPGVLDAAAVQRAVEVVGGQPDLQLRSASACVLVQPRMALWHAYSVGLNALIHFV